jgi:hypothetical protein
MAPDLMAGFSVYRSAADFFLTARRAACLLLTLTPIMRPWRVTGPHWRCNDHAPSGVLMPSAPAAWYSDRW